MGVSFIPGPRQFGADGGGGDSSGSSQGLVQLALAVKAFKMQEADQKRAQAQQKAQLLMSNPQLLVMSDPKDVERALKEGYDLKFNADQPTDPRQAQAAADKPKATPTGSGPTNLPLGNVSVDQLSALSNATQGNKSGAQAGAPASPDAANKAPGGGVTSGLGPSVVEHLASEAKNAFNQKYGAVAPLYAGAMTQLDQEALKAQTIGEIEHLKQRAGAGDLQAMGRLAMMSNKQVTDSDMRAMIMSSNMDPKVIQQAMDYALGNETDADKAKRFDSAIKSIYGSPETMSRLENPLDATSIARSIVYGGALPEGIKMKPLSMSQLKDEAEYEKYLVTDVQIPYDYAHLIARSRSLGVDQPLPQGMQTLTGPVSFDERYKTGSMKETETKRVAADAEMKKAENEGLRIQASLTDKKHDILNDRLRSMVEAQKAKHPWPDDVQNALINEVAREAGLMPEEVHHWYDFTSGKQWSYTPIPADDVAQEAAGGSKKKKKGSEQESLPMQIIRQMFNTPKPTV